MTGGALQVLPTAGTIYAGEPFTISITGGRTPYVLTSSEPGILSVPSQTDSHTVTLIAGNPGVVDVGLTAGELQVRTVNIFVRSSDGQTTAGLPFKVAQNFLTGYGVAFSPLTCPIATGSSQNVQACAGGETAVQMDATVNGALHGDQPFHLVVLKGPFAFVFPQGGTGNAIDVVSDHTGRVSAIIQMTAGVPTQLGVIRVQDPVTGVYADTVFTITGVANNGALTAIPNAITFTGNLTTDCGVGTSSFFVFDGSPPYTALSSEPSITVSPSQSTTNPGQFSVTSSRTTPPCPSGTIVVTDEFGSRVSIDVTSKPGTGTPPTPPAFTVAPTTITLGCGQSGSVTAVGGSGNYSVNSTNPTVTAAVSNSTVTITRAGVNPGVGTQSTTVSVTDGSTIQTVTVTSPATCS